MRFRLFGERASACHLVTPEEAKWYAALCMEVMELPPGVPEGEAGVTEVDRSGGGEPE